MEEGLRVDGCGEGTEIFLAVLQNMKSAINRLVIAVDFYGMLMGAAA